MDLRFERKQKSKSLSLILALLVVILVVLAIPEMLISRSNVIVKYRLDTTSTDTSFVHLVKVANSYLETADMFVIFSLQTDKIRSKISAKSLKRFLQSCQDTKEPNFCELWQQILSEEQLKQCPKCAEK